MSENNKNKEVSSSVPDSVDRHEKRVGDEVVGEARFSSARVRAVMESLPFVAMEINSDYEVLWANESVLSINKNAKGRKCFDALRGRKEPCRNCPCKSAARTDSIHVSIIEADDGKGNISYWEEFASPIPDHDRNPGGFFIVARDITAFRRSEEELIKANEQFRFIIENQADLVVRTDPKGQLLFVGPSFCDLTGLSSDQIEKIEFIDIVAKDDRKQLSEVFRSLIEQPRNVSFRHQLKSDDGQRWLSWSFKAVLDNNGQPSSLIGVGRDVTAQKKQEDILLQSRQRLAFHVQRTPLAYIEWNPQLEVLDWNPSAERIFGYSHDEVLGKHAFELIVDKNRQDVFTQMWSNLISRQGGARITTTNVTKDGRRITCEWYNTALMDESLAVVGITSLVEDITERIETEEALKHSEEKFLMLAENIKEIFWLRTLTEVLYESPAFEDVWGVPAEAMYENPFIHVESMLPEDRDKFLGVMASEEFMNNGTFDMEYRIKRADGEIRWVRDRGWPVKNEKGEIARLAGLAEDITEKKKAAEENRKLQQQLIYAQKMEAVGLLAGGVSHEFNNMLAVIMGNVNLAFEKIKTGQNVSQELGNIMEASEQAGNISSQLLSFARRTKPEIKRVYIDNLIQNLMQMISRTFPESVGIKVKPQKNPVSVNVDVNQMTQALVNICNNARDSMPDGGALSIRTIRKKLGVRFCASRTDISPGNFCLIEFTDTGTGIEDAYQDKVIEPFFTTKEVGKGTGLGLSVTMGIIQNHHGFMEFNSRPGKGTKVMVYLPVAE